MSEFIHQKSYEKIVYQVRRHPVTFVPAILGFLFLACIAPIAWYLVRSLWPDLLNGPVSSVLLSLLGSVYLLSVAIFFYTYFVTFYLDVLVVTNDRLMSIKQQGLFSRTVSELDLYKIQDITSEVHGVFASLFGYGTLTIETAGAKEGFVIENIPHPEHLRESILDLAEEDRKYHSNTVVERSTGVLP